MELIQFMKNKFLPLINKHIKLIRDMYCLCRILIALSVAAFPMFPHCVQGSVILHQYNAIVIHIKRYTFCLSNSKENRLKGKNINFHYNSVDAFDFNSLFTNIDFIVICHHWKASGGSFNLLRFKQKTRYIMLWFGGINGKLKFQEPFSGDGMEHQPSRYIHEINRLKIQRKSCHNHNKVLKKQSTPIKW